MFTSANELSQTESSIKLTIINLYITCLNREGKRYCSQHSIHISIYGERERESLSQEELSNKDIGFLEFFDAIFSLPSLHDPGGWAERLHHVRAWSLGMDVAGGAQRLVLLGRKETSEHRETSAQGGKKQQQQSSLCINFASFFHLYLSSSLLSSSSLVLPISFDTYHYSLFGNPPHAKRTPFISTHQPSHPKYGISQAALDLTH